MTEGATALERYRMRKQMKQQQLGVASADESYLNNSLTQQDDDTTMNLSTRGLGYLSSTPSRRGSVATRLSSVPIQNRRQSFSVMSSQDSISSTQSLSQNGLSQLTVDEDQTLDSVEGAGLRSRLHEMQKLVDKLEKEVAEVKQKIREAAQSDPAPPPPPLPSAL